MPQNQDLNVNIKVNGTKQATADVKTFGNAIKKNVANTSGDATILVQNLGEGLGDLQYGFKNIGNNAEIVGGAFTRLINKTGGVRGAFTAITSALAGPAGILTAITLLINFGPQLVKFFQEWAGSVEKTKEEIAKLHGEVDALIKFQDDLLGQYADPVVQKWADQLGEVGNNASKLAPVLAQLAFEQEELSKQVERDNEVLEKSKKPNEDQIKRMRMRADRLKELNTLLSTYEKQLTSLEKAQQKYDNNRRKTDAQGAANAGKEFSPSASVFSGGLSSAGFTAGGLSGGGNVAGLGSGLVNTQLTSGVPDLVGKSKETVSAFEEIGGAATVAGGAIAALQTALSSGEDGGFKAFANSVIGLAQQIAFSMAIAAATKDGLKTGGFLIPALIGLALGAVKSAFSSIGASSRGGGGAVSSGTALGSASTQGPLTRVQGLNAPGGQLVAKVSGDDLFFMLQQATERRSGLN